MPALLLRTQVRCINATRQALDPAHRPDIDRGSTAAPAVRDRGQATTEYALVMLGAAAIALLVITWATAGGGAGKVGRLFDKVIDAVSSKM
jgi:hypothetical protein